MLKKLLHLVIIVLWMPLFVSAQETISIMYYNLLNFPNTNSSRISHLETTVQYFLPDIFAVTELTSSTGANTILNSALNANGITYYQSGTYVNTSNLNNLLYYNSEKLGLISQYEISTALRDINEYVLYYKAPDLTAESDTVYLYMYVAHLKAGNQQSDIDDRTNETNVLKNHLAARPYSENTIVGGDFNIYTSSEPAYNNLTSVSHANLHDVIGPGSYHDNPSFAIHFTQSTRTTSFDGGATGGMDDRFDYMLFSHDLINGGNNAKYKANSYRAIGQDGLRLNQSLIDPTNNSEPTDIINALYYMSDHLPVYMEIEVGGDVGIDEMNIESKLNIYPVPANDHLVVDWNIGSTYSGSIADIQGKEILKFQSNGQLPETIGLDGLKSGTYFLTFFSDLGRIVRKITIE